MEQMKKKAEQVGSRIGGDGIVEVDVSTRPRRCTGDSGDVDLAESVIVATGAQARWLGLPSERQFNGRGVSACATCDGFFYRDKDVVVVGGGNTAVEEALYLANICSSVTLVHRRDTLRAEKIMQERLFRHPKVRVIWDHVIDEVLGGDGPFDGVEAVRLKHARSGETTVIPAEGMFVAIGHDPATKPFRGQLPVDGEGYLIVEQGTPRTTVPGVFAAGDCVEIGRAHV